MFRTFILSVCLACCSIVGMAAEVVVNGNDPEAWKFEVQPPAVATIRQDEGGLRIDVTTASKEPFHVQVYQPDKSPISGRTYIVRFAAKATSVRPIIVLGQFQDNPWSLVTEFTSVEIGRDWKEYAINLTMKEARPKGVRLPVIQFGQATGTVWIRDISVLESGEKPVASTSAVAGASEQLKATAEPSNWQLEQQGPAKATLRSEEGSLRIDITARSDDRSNLRLYQAGRDLVPGQKYVLKFIAKASAPRVVGLTAQTDQSPFTGLIGDETIEFSTRWQLYTLEFVADKAVPQHTRIPVLSLGGEIGTVWLRDASVTGSAGSGSRP